MVIEPRGSAGSNTPPWAALAVVLVGAFMAVADFFIVNVALPSIAASLAAGAAALELIVAGYGVAYATALVSGGRLGDTLGRRGLFLAGIAGFTVTSAACGLAPTATVLIAGRVLQGLSAAAMVPQVLATIQASFTGEDRRRALGVYGATLGVATVAGQLLGGLIVAANLFGLAWRPAFLLNVPVGLAGLIAAWRVLPDTRSDAPQRLDAVGAGLLGLAVVALLVPLTTGRELGWPLWSWCALSIVPELLTAFLLWELRLERAGGDPILPLSLLRHSGVRPGLGAVALFAPAFGGFFFTTALSLQRGRHLGPLAAGIVMIPFALAFLAASLGGGRLAGAQVRRAITGGALLIAGAYLALGLIAWRDFGGESFWVLAPAMATAGLGQGIVVPPLFGVVLAGVPARRAGTASGVLMTAFQTGLAVGVGGLGLVFLQVAGPAAAEGPAHFGPATAIAYVLEAALALGGAAVCSALPRTAPAEAAPGAARARVLLEL
ncbi:MAG TPA: MFS transporter [Candidatus Dormibacteraeota bacterium]|jgi:MFS family permease|nr:MFS transporter [Candidatus Dormibacteraeota bacterium]